ncbi:hypothetical protein BH10BAC2_BH10BAC2_44360 [soil metagenome]
MKKIVFITSIISLSIITHSSFAQKNETEKQIRYSLQVWNEAAKQKDTISIMNMFDKAEDIMVVGSDSGEIFKGQAAVKQFIGWLFSQYSFYWEWDRVDIAYNEKTAWAFTDGRMSVTDANSNTIITPYRFTAIFVKRSDGWKWRLYNGSIPKGEAE